MASIKTVMAKAVKTVKAVKSDVDNEQTVNAKTVKAVKTKTVKTVKAKTVKTVIQKQGPIVFIDLSNYIFQRYFAITAWARISGFEFDEGEAGKVQFFRRYSDMFEKHLLLMQKKLKFDWSEVYFAIDCPRDQIWRNHIYNEYKKNRDIKSQSIQIDGQVFPLTYDELLPKFRKENNANFKMLRYQTAEADDIVGVLHHKFRRDYPDRNIVVITNDNDYLQLMDDNTQIMNASFKNIRERVPQELTTGKSYILYKVIKGDTADNIPSIGYKIGDKMAIKLATDESALEEQLANDKVRMAFEMNQVLMNFEYIPSDLRDGICNLV